MALNMAFNNEAELYGIVMRACDFLAGIDEMRDHVNSRRVDTWTRGREDKTVYFVGEEHYSRASIDHVHRHIAPDIQNSPEDWLFLIEGGLILERDPVDSPSHYYLQGLATLHNIPIDEALANIDFKSTRQYIMDNSSLTARDIDRIILKGAMAEERPGASSDPEVIDRMARNIGKPKATVRKLLAMDPTPLDMQDLGPPWNECSKVRLGTLLQGYQGRSKVLVYTGWAHSPAFE